MRPLCPILAVLLAAMTATCDQQCILDDISVVRFDVQVTGKLEVQESWLVQNGDKLEQIDEVVVTLDRVRLSGTEEKEVQVKHNPSITVYRNGEWKVVSSTLENLPAVWLLPGVFDAVTVYPRSCLVHFRRKRRFETQERDDEGRNVTEVHWTDPEPASRFFAAAPAEDRSAPLNVDLEIEPGSGHRVEVVLDLAGALVPDPSNGSPHFAPRFH